MSETDNQKNNQENQDETNEQEATVPRSVYERAVKIEKKAKAERDEFKKKADELGEKIQELEEKLSSEKDDESTREARRQRRKDVELVQAKLKEVEAKGVALALRSEFLSRAARAGCSHPKKLLQLIDIDELKSVEVDTETYDVNADDIDRIIESAKAENEMFFKKETRKLPRGKSSYEFVDGLTGLEKLKALDKLARG